MWYEIAPAMHRKLTNENGPSNIERKDEREGETRQRVFLQFMRPVKRSKALIVDDHVKL